jgi:hypothetical protein
MFVPSVSVEPDGSLLVAGPQVLMIATGRRPPLAVAVRPPRLRAGAIYLNLAASEPGRARIEVSLGSTHKLIAALTRALPAGVSTVRLPPLPRGAQIVRVTLRGRGQVATGEAAIVSGPVLPESLAREAISRSCCEGKPPLAPVTLAHAAHEGEVPSLIACQRLGIARVDCKWGFAGRCDDVTSAVLREALVYLTDTNSCSYSRRTARPHAPPLIAPLF